MFGILEGLHDGLRMVCAAMFVAIVMVVLSAYANAQQCNVGQNSNQVNTAAVLQGLAQNQPTVNHSQQQLVSAPQFGGQPQALVQAPTSSATAIGLARA